MRTFIVGFALVLSAVPAFAQTDSDERWTPWLGCWDLVLENAREGSPSIESARELPRSSATDPIRPRVCVERAPGGGATLRTTIGTQNAITQTLVADGADRPITDADCQGTQRVEWSRTGLRLFVQAQLTCKNDPAPRRVSGFAMLGANATWTDIQAIDIGGRESYRVRRYRRADSAAIAPARSQGAALSLDDVKEASGKVSAHALEAALVETRASFRLSSRRVIELADAKVPERVIDLMVALSYPKRFVVETARVDRAPAMIGDDPFLFGFGYASPLYGYYSPYYYSPFAYSYARGYNPFYGYGGYEVIGAGGGGVSRPDRPSGSGRVVDGSGYTRVRPRESEPSTASRQGRGAPIVSGESGSSSSSSSSGSSESSSGSSGSSSVSSGGFSSGASSGDTGRTAQPR